MQQAENVTGEVWTARYPSLDGDHVLITGGATGIGEHIVEAFLQQGCRVTCIDIDAGAGEALAARLGAEGQMAFVHQDLTDIAGTKAMLEDASGRFGPPRVLVNNAASDDRHQVAEVTPEYWDNRMAVNLRHYFFCSQALLPAMVEAGKGSIINMGSISWHLGLPDLALYQIANAGIEGLTRSLARDYGQHGVRVNCIIPGGIKTPRQDELWHTEEVEREMLENQCLKSRVLPRDVAAMVLFLASDDARMCTGHNYFVDGGWV